MTDALYSQSCIKVYHLEKWLVRLWKRGR